MSDDAIKRRVIFAGEPRCELYLGDCLELLPLVGKVDAVVTDPPYGVGKAEWDGAFPTGWIEPAWKLTERMIVMAGSDHVKVANYVGRYRDCVAICASNGMTRGPLGFGNWFSALICGDWTWAARQNVIVYNVSLDETIDHPSPKPKAAMLKLIRGWTEKEWRVLDPFMGSGTTGVACMKLGRQFIGIEIDPGYFEIAVRRITEAREEVFNRLPFEGTKRDEQLTLIEP